MDSTSFERAVRPECVSESLRLNVPEFRSGAVRLLGCRVTRLRSAEGETGDGEAGGGGRWTATYLLEVSDDADGSRSITAHGMLVPQGVTPPAADPSAGITEDGWSCWLPDLRLHLHTWSADDALPGMHAITHDRTATAVLEPLLRRHVGADDLGLSECTATIASYKPGVRATVCCDLGYTVANTPPAWPSSVVAKVHRPEDGRACHSVLEALWSSPLRSSAVVRIAEPLGYLDDLGISVQSYLEHGQTLKDLLAEAFATTSDSRLVDAVRGAAGGLAALHSSGVAGGPVTTWAEELGTVEAKHAKLAAVVPWLAGLTGTSLARIAAAAERTEAGPPFPAHGSFRPAQVLLLAGGGLGLIDFDKAARAEPAMDIGLFLSKVRHTAVNKTGEHVEPDSLALEQRSALVDAVSDTFVRAYREVAPVTEERIRLWEALELFSLVLSAAKKMLPDRAATCAAMLDRHLRAHGL